MTIDSVTGVITWSPTASDQGTHTIQVASEDGLGGKATQSFQLNAVPAPPNRPPLFTTAPATSVDSGDDYNYSPAVTDPDSDTPTFSLLSAPTGLNVNTSTGELTWTAPADGNYNVSLQADDGNGGLAVQSFALSVGNVGSANGSPIITSTPDTEATVGSLYFYQPAATDPEGDTLTVTGLFDVTFLAELRVYGFGGVFDRLAELS